MCGIAGILSLTPIRCSDAEAITERLAHRGPDAQAIFISQDQLIGLGHRRLSVIDLSDSANQPMRSTDGRYVIVFNGEIYNYITLRNELVKVGKQFKTSSDTEVLLVGFEIWGVEILNRLEGMFAFAILDQIERTIFLARDRVGKKPLYYCSTSQYFIFASEPKAILAYKVWSPEINRCALVDFLRLGYIPDPETPWKDIYRLPAGSWALVTSTLSVKISSYWCVADHVSKRLEASEAMVFRQFSEILNISVAKRLVSDVPLGALLSGGTDSALICAIANEHLQGKLKTFNIGFEDKKHDERMYADKVAKVLGTDHHSFILSSKDALTYMHEYLDHFDEPFADTSSIPTLFVSKKTREHVTVALTGDGGDELFLGYGRYQWAERLNKWGSVGKFLSPLARNLPVPISRAGEIFAIQGSHQQLFTAEQGFFSEAELEKLLKPPIRPFNYAEARYPEMTNAERQALFDFHHYLKDCLLVKVDRASMKYALECRCPLLDHKMVEFAVSLPVKYKVRSGVRKYLMKKLLEQYLPAELVHRPKRGFSIPLEQWLSSEFRFMIDDYLSSLVIRRYGIVEEREVSKIVKQFKKGDKQLYHRIWCLIVLHRWLVNHVK